MIDEDPVVIVRRLLREQWQNDNIDDSFDIDSPQSIHAGHPGERRGEPQITIIHVGDSTTGNTGYNYITPEGPATRTGVRLQIDVWVPNSSRWPSAGRARAHRWQLQQEVDRIIHANAGGTTDRDGNRQLQYLGTISRRRSTQTDPSPEVFRASMDIRCIYFQLPPLAESE